MSRMGYAEAQEVLKSEHSYPLPVRLKAHAALWREAPGVMSEHAPYIQEAAERIAELESALREALDIANGSEADFTAAAIAMLQDLEEVWARGRA